MALFIRLFLLSFPFLFLRSPELSNTVIVQQNVSIQNNYWKKITTKQNISFSFPNNPEVKKNVAYKMPSVIYQTKDLICVYGVVCSDFSNLKEVFYHENIDDMYKILKEASIKEADANFVSERTIKENNLKIREIKYTLMNSGYEMTYIKRFIFRAPYIYQISIGARTRNTEYLNNRGMIFFNSVRFFEKSEVKTAIKDTLKIKKEENNGKK